MLSQAQLADALPTVTLLAASVCVLAAKYIKALNPLLKYGKTWERSSKSQLSWLFNSTVPKRWFYHFYILSLAVVCVRSVQHGLSLRRLLLIIQASRRLAEELLLFRPSNAKIHLTHYIVGIVFYFIQAWFHPATSSPLYFRVLGIILFIVGSIGQADCHWVLAHTKKYSFPDFRLRSVSCPHYFFELLIYLGLLCISVRWVPAYATVIWILVNLGASSLETHQYYNQRGASARFAIIPYVL